MPDPVDPSQPPPVSHQEPEAASKSTSTGLPANVAAAIACIPLIGGIIFYILEKQDNFVRFYAMQSIIFGIAWILVSIACGIIAGLFGAHPDLWNVVSSLIHLALFVIMVVAIVKAFTGVRWEIPYIGPIARKQVGEAQL